MSSNPLNLVVRFLLELAAIASMGYWGWTQHEGVLRVVLAFGLPLLAMLVWGTFRVPDDPRDPPVVVSGIVRLLIEFVVFGLAFILLYNTDRQSLAIVFGVVVVVHYVISYDRIVWLLTER